MSKLEPREVGNIEDTYDNGDIYSIQSIISNLKRYNSERYNKLLTE